MFKEKRRPLDFYKKEMNSYENVLISTSVPIYIKKLLLDRFYPSSMNRCLKDALNEYVKLIEPKVVEESNKANGDL